MLLTGYREADKLFIYCLWAPAKELGDSGLQVKFHSPPIRNGDSCLIAASSRLKHSSLRHVNSLGRQCAYLANIAASQGWRK